MVFNGKYCRLITVLIAFLPTSLSLCISVFLFLCLSLRLIVFFLLFLPLFRFIFLLLFHVQSVFVECKARCDSNTLPSSKLVDFFELYCQSSCFVKHQVCKVGSTGYPFFYRRQNVALIKYIYYTFFFR